MSLADALVGKEELTQPTAPVAGQTPAPAEAPAKADAPVEAPAPVENIAEGVLGSTSDKWEFVGNLTDGSQKDPFEITKNGVKEVVDNGKVIGYTLKALDNGLRYPRFKITPHLTSNPFAKTSEIEFLTAKKGEKVHLTLLEAVTLASLPENNGVIAGGKVTVQAVYSIPAASAEAAASGKKAPVTGYLKSSPGFPSIKAAPTTIVIIRGEKTGEGQYDRVNRSIAKGYERFAPAIEEKPRATAGATGTEAGKAIDTFKTSRNEKAAKFLASLGVSV